MSSTMVATRDGGGEEGGDDDKHVGVSAMVTVMVVVVRGRGR